MDFKNHAIPPVAEAKSPLSLATPGCPGIPGQPNTKSSIQGKEDAANYSVSTAACSAAVIAECRGRQKVDCSGVWDYTRTIDETLSGVLMCV